VTPDAADNSRPIFDSEPLQKVSNNENYNVFAIKSEHPEQSNSINDTYPIEQDKRNVIIDSLDMSYDREQLDRDDDDDLANERDLLASLIEKLKVTPDAADNSRPIFDSEPLQKVSNNDNYNVFAIESEHPEQSNSINDRYPIEQDKRNVIIDSLDMSYDREQLDRDDDDLANERDLLASLIEKLKCKIDASKNRNKFLEISSKALVDKLKGEIEDFKIKNKSLESSNNHFQESNNELSKTN
nr:hypothetical protein [Tanacetum cinerariifolium]